MNRRAFLQAAAGAAALPVLASRAMAQNPPAVLELRGAIDAAGFGVNAGAPDDQTVALQAALNAASEADQPLFLQPGRYLVSSIALPRRARLIGIAGATTLVHSGGGRFVVGYDSDLVHLTDLVFDGGDLPLDEFVPGGVHLSNVREARISGCRFVASGAAGLALDRSGGRIIGNDIVGARFAGIRAIESTGLLIDGNAITDCADNGILVYRWTEGTDGTIVTGNRIARIGAASGGTGPFGNGINVYQAHNVMVAQNSISDCAFSAVRANGADNIQIVGNNCAGLGETAIYSEFAFEAALIANNIVDGAASGISVANFIDGGRIASVTGNIVRNITGIGPYETQPPGFGIGIYVEADTAVTGNVVDGAALAGLWLGWGPYLRNVTATGNVIRGAPTGIAVSVVDGVGTAVISANLISGAERGAIIGMRWAEAATGDLADGENAPHGLVVVGNQADMRL